MDYNQYNLNRYNKKKQWYRVKLGIGQLLNYPILNLIWLIFCIGTVYLVKGKQVLLSAFYVPKILAPIFAGCMMFFVIIFPVVIAIGIIQGIGELAARKDEADIFKAFGDRKDVKMEAPILIYKKKIKKKDVTIREFYTAIPMERWQEKKEAICDRLNIHIIGDIEYGGKNNNNGNRIVIKSAKGRKTSERGVIYDNTF